MDNVGKGTFRAIERLWVIVAAPPTALTPSRWRWLLRVELTSLASKLEQRFAREESGGYMRQVIERRPQRARLVEMLHQQHGAITEQLAWLLEILRDPTTDIETLKSRVRDALGLLEAHEHGERELAQEARYPELSMEE